MRMESSQKENMKNNIVVGLIRKGKYLNKRIYVIENKGQRINNAREMMKNIIKERTQDKKQKTED